MHKKRDNKSIYRSLAMITQFGVNMLVPICLMSALGIYLDKCLDTSYWMILLFFVGAIAGGQNVFRMAKQIYAPSGERNTVEKHANEKRNDIKTKVIKPENGQKDADMMNDVQGDAGRK